MTNPHAWDTYAQQQPGRRVLNAAGARTWFNFTQYPDHGPGAEMLGIGPGASVLDLGCGKGGNLAHVAELGARAVGVDLSAPQLHAARERWGDGLQLHQGDAFDYLTGHPAAFDAIYSVFGAAWFVDPAKLLPAVRSALRPGGVFAFSHRPPITDCYGCQASYIERGPDTDPHVVRRWDYEPDHWRALLDAHGFTATTARVLKAPPGPRTVGTLLVRAVADPHMSDAPRTHELTLQRGYFDLVSAGEKTVEVRVRYPRLESLAAGDTIRFQIKRTDQRCDVRVRRVTRYETFEALLDGEGPANVDPKSPCEQQLANMREIYPPEKEQLGALAIEIEVIGRNRKALASPVVDTHVILRDRDKILMSQRGGPYGYGRWHLPSGKLDAGEPLTTGAARELYEETGVTVEPDHLRHVHTVHHRQSEEIQRIGVFFLATEWSGEPTNREPDKCLDLRWQSVHDLPEDVIEYPAAGLHGYLAGTTLTEHGW